MKIFVVTENGNLLAIVEATTILQAVYKYVDKVGLRVYDTFDKNSHVSIFYGNFELRVEEFSAGILK